jgi:nucleotide-binding universal stress UspA family protein
MNIVPEKIDVDIKRVLVLLNEEILGLDDPRQATLIDRAIALSHATGCELELFHVCHDTALQQPLFQSDEEVVKKRENLADLHATKLAELALILKTEGVVARHEARWDHPRAEAILRKINESQPDLVMKRFNEQSYVLGMLGTDWELIRQSPCHLWFVKENHEKINKSETEIHRLITSVGTLSDDDIFSPADYDVFRVANAIASYFDAENVPVHAYQVPQNIAAYGTYAPFLGGFSAPIPEAETTLDERWQDIAQIHGASIRAFAEFFHINPELVQICQGNPDEVLQELAGSLHADLIIMAARNLNRWERLVGSLSGSVSAEPVLSDSPCDVLFIKQDEGINEPAAIEGATRGASVYDLEKAIINPEETFNTPHAVLDAKEISIPFRLRILQAWEQDIRQQLAMEDEGGPVMTVNVDTLAAINACKDKLTCPQ